jgi:hypothetical protein
MKFLVFVVLIAFSKCSSNKLIGSVVLMRHGSRAPKYFPEHNHNLFLDIGSYGLTINGYRQATLLGLYLNNRYTQLYDLLAKEVNTDEIKLFSTSTQRTLFTLTGLINSLFPGTDLDLTSTIKDIKFDQTTPMPAVFNTKKLKVEVMEEKNAYLHPWKCNLNNKELTYIFKEQPFNITNIQFTSEEQSSILTDIKGKIDFLNEANMLTDREIIKRAVDFLKCSDFLSKTNTYNLSPQTMNSLKKVSLDKWYSHRLNKDYENIVKISVSKFFVYLKDYLYQRSKGVEKTKLTVFSAHDTNIVDTLVNLLDREFLLGRISSALNGNNDAFNFLIPPFNSNILFELYVIDNKHYVRIFYNGTELKDNFIAKVPYMRGMGIPLENFRDLLTQRIASDYKNLVC